jgi:hypothetical protein
VVLIQARVVLSRERLVRKAARPVRRCARGTRGSDCGFALIDYENRFYWAAVAQGHIRTGRVLGARN